MSSVIIVTDLFRASHVHLKKRKSFNEKDEPAFRVAALFPQDGIGEIAPLGIQFESSPDSIKAAIKEVVMTEFNFDYDFDNVDQNKALGIEYGPYVKNGNLVLKKDANKQPIPGEYCPISNGNFIFNMKNVEDVGCASGVTGKAIDPVACYSGCWGRAQLEISAYTTKGTTPSRIVSVKLINFQMCYDDESFGDHGPTQSAEEAFAGMNVSDSNLSVSTGNSEFRPEVSKPIQKTPPRSLTGTIRMNLGCEYTYQELVDADFSDQDIIDGGYATKEIVKKVLPVKKTPPPKKTAPVKKTPPAKTPPRSLTGTVTMNPDSVWTYQELLDEGYTDQDMIDNSYATKAASAPVKKLPPAKKLPPKKKALPMKSVPTTGTVIMNDDSEYTYEYLSVENGWTDDEIVNSGYAKPNFTNLQ